MKILEKITSPLCIKEMDLNELSVLAEEIREAIILKTSKRGGNVASNLAVVEATIAIHRVFDKLRHQLTVVETVETTILSKSIHRAFDKLRHHNSTCKFTDFIKHNKDQTNKKFLIHNRKKSVVC